MTPLDPTVPHAAERTRVATGGTRAADERTRAKSRLTPLMLTASAVLAVLVYAAGMVRVLTATPPSGDLGPWTGAVTDSSAEVVTRIADGQRVTLHLLSPGSDRPTTQPAATFVAEPSADRLVRFRFSGLNADTEYQFELHMAQHGQPRKGRFRTFPLPGSRASFRFTLGACQRTGSNHPVHDAIAGHRPLFHLITGDFHYEDITEPKPELFARAYARVFGSASQQRLYAQVPIAYIWDDHDYAGNNSDRTSPARSTARAAFQRWIPHYPLAMARPASTSNAVGTTATTQASSASATAGETAATADKLPANAVAGSMPALPFVDVPLTQRFEVGRVLFLLTDLRSERDPHREPDHSGKTMLGAEQRDWLLAQLEAASERKSHALIFWVSGVPWVVEPDADADHWGGYAHERAQISAAISACRVPVCILTGDAHMLAADDGSHSAFADARSDGGVAAPGRLGPPVLAAAAMDKSASDKGGTYSHGKYLPQRREGLFGLVDVTDHGDRIQVRFEGRNHDNETRVQLSFMARVR